MDYFNSSLILTWLIYWLNHSITFSTIMHNILCTCFLQQTYADEPKNWKWSIIKRNLFTNASYCVGMQLLFRAKIMYHGVVRQNIKSNSSRRWLCMTVKDKFISFCTFFVNSCLLFRLKSGCSKLFLPEKIHCISMQERHLYTLHFSSYYTKGFFMRWRTPTK